MLDYAMSLNEDSPVARVFATASGAAGMATLHPGPDTTSASVLFANGVRGLWNNGATAPRTGDPNTDYQHCRVSAFARRGQATWEEFGKWEIASPEGVEGGRATMDSWAAGNDAAQAALINAILDWIQDADRPPGTHLKRALHQWKAVLALYASALWRRPVEMEDFHPPVDLFDQLEAALL